MRDLLKEFDNDVKVIKEWFNDDSGKPQEHFIITLSDKEYKSYKSMSQAMDRAIAISSRRSRRHA